MENAKMFTSERFKLINDYLKEHSRATIEELAKVLFVSPATVRRDLTEMQKLGMIQRTHGGAVYSESADEVSIFARISKNAQDKERTATIALNHLPDFSTVFIDNSSTCLALAERLNLEHKTIVTNGLLVAMTLSKKKDVKTIVLGGDIQYNTNSAEGDLTIEMLRNFRLDLMLSSCASLQIDGSYEHGIQAMELKRAAFQRSNRHLLLVDRTKFEMPGMYRTQTLADYDVIFTNADNQMLAPYRAKNPNIVNQ